MAWSKKFPSPPLAWSARLSSRTFRYSGVSGGSCPNPHGFVWSNDGCPPSPGTTKRAHAPFQSGYLGGSAALALPIGIARAATAIVVTKLRQCIVTSLTIIALHHAHAMRKVLRHGPDFRRDLPLTICARGVASRSIKD